MKAPNKKQHLTTYLIGDNMRILLVLTLLAGCSNIQDNTTVSDKMIIGGVFATMAYGAATLGDW